MTQPFLILDFDECIFEHPPEIEQYYPLAYAEIGIKYGYPFAVEEAMEHAKEHFLRDGVSNFMFEGHFDIWAPYEEIHDYLLDRYISGFVSEIRARNIGQHFEGLAAEMCILTHGTTRWAAQNLKHLGIDHLFDERRIIGLEKTGYKMKCKSETPFRMALECLGLQPEDLSGETVYFIDDSARNHVIPSKLGIKTIHVGRHWLRDKDLPHIDASYPKLGDFLNTLKEKAAPKDGQVYG